MSTAFNYLDDASFRVLYCPENNHRRMKFYIEGIRCGKCVSKIEGLKNQNSELKFLEVDLAHQTAVVELQNVKGSFAQVAQSIESLGFTPVPLQNDHDSIDSWNLEARKDLVRLATAGFCAGNIMILAFSVYFGVEGDLRSKFEWLQFFLYLPVVSFVAIPFYKGFFQGIRNHTISIDGPMAIASLLGFLISSVNLFRHSGSLYFDSTSGFLFLILATRYWQKRTRHEYLRFLSPVSLADTFKARLKESGGWSWVPSNKLSKNQIVIVEKNEWIPADGNLLSDSAVLDLSLLDGESRSRFVRKGFPLKAGTKLLSDKAELEVVTSGKKTMIGQLLSVLDEKTLEDTESSILSNKASHWLMTTVLSLAIFVLIIGSFIDFNTYFERAFALLVLACPCAMAFGTPLAFSFSMKRSQEKGLLIKSAQVFEKLKDIRTLYLDKTGTLTSKNWELSESQIQGTPKNNYREIILALEATSEHPVAYALRELWPDSVVNLNLHPEVVRVVENGIEAKFEGAIWKFCSFEEQSIKWFGLFQNQVLVWKFQLKSQIKTNVQDFISSFRKRGYQIVILSGDSQEETLRVGKLLGIEDHNIISNLSAYDKAQIVKSNSKSMMIGDGVNDALALKQARVGVAVHGGVDLALNSADVLLLNENLDSIRDLFEIGSQARRQIKLNLTTALVYNSFGGMAALFGFVNPFVAALLMPISSLYILASTWKGTRK
jgi:P-type Cu+ transporter